MDLTTKKQSFLSDLAALCDQVLLQAQKIDGQAASYFANAFNVGAANQIVDADCTGPNSQLSQSIVTNAITTLQAIQSTLTSAQRDNLRKAIATGVD